MQIRDREDIADGRERVTVVPDTVDDLWHLQYVIEPGDRVAGDTHRRIQRADDRIRETGGQREHMWVALAVENVEFHRFANRLRVGGEIVGCSREDQLGFQHTLNVEIHDEISIEKRFKPDQWSRIEDAVAATEDPDVAVATIEEGSASVFTVSQAGPEERTSLSGPSGKGEYADERTELFAELGAVLSRLDVDSLILAGPGFTKQEAHQYIVDAHPELDSMIQMVDTSSGGTRGVHEVLQRGALEKARTTQRVGREATLVEELMQRIGSNGSATYGVDEVAAAAEYGAIEQLLILDERLREERADGDWSVDIDHVVRQVDQQGGEVIVFSGEFEPGRKLANLGGIAALLRYRIE